MTKNVSATSGSGSAGRESPACAPAGIIAIGTSAGGLTALAEVLKDLPRTLRYAVLVVLHLAPEFNSHAAEVLARHTSLRVRQATDEEVLRAGVVYVAPPDFHLNVNNGAIKLTHAAAIRFSRPSIDSMFQSVAANYKKVIAVVLTGSGQDGADGLRAIKAAGGFTIVQDPGTAQFSAMPTASVATRCADRIVPLAEIGPLLARLSADMSTAHRP